MSGRRLFWSDSHCIRNPWNTWSVCFSLPGLISWQKMLFSQLLYQFLDIREDQAEVFEKISKIIHHSKYWLACHRPPWLCVKIILITTLVPLKSLALSLTEHPENLRPSSPLPSPHPHLHLYRGPVGPGHDQHAYQGQGQGSERWTHAGRGAGAAQVEQTSLEAHLPGVLPQSLPDGADFLLTVGQRREGTCVERFPVAVANKASSDQRRACHLDRSSSLLQHADAHWLSWINLLANNLSLRWLCWFQVSQTEL